MATPTVRWVPRPFVSSVRMATGHLDSFYRTSHGAPGLTLGLSLSLGLGLGLGLGLVWVWCNLRFGFDYRNDVSNLVPRVCGGSGRARRQTPGLFASRAGTTHENCTRERYHFTGDVCRISAVGGTRNPRSVYRESV